MSRAVGLNVMPQRIRAPGRVSSSATVPEVLAVTLVVVYPPAGLAALLLYRIISRRRMNLDLSWHPRIPIIAIFLLLSLLDAYKGNVPVNHIATVAIIVGGAFVARVSTPSLWTGYVIGLGISLALMAFGTLTSRYTWHALQDTQVTADRYTSMVLGRQTILGNGTDRSSLSRFWTTSSENSHLALSFRARASSASPGQHWFAYNLTTPLEPRYENERHFVRVHPSPEAGAFITRRTNTNAPLSGRSFALTFDYRSADYATPSACQGVIVRELGGYNYRKCFPLDSSADWSRQEITWEFPPHSSSTSFRVEVNSPARWYDIGNADVIETTDEILTPVTLEPTGLHISIAVPGAPQYSWPTFQVPLDQEWKEFTFLVEDERITKLHEVRTVLLVENGYRISIRDTRLLLSSGQLAEPRASPERQSGLHIHPNLAGHSIAAVGLSAASTAGTWLGTTAPIVIAALSLLKTGSRTAWITLLIGGAAILFRRLSLIKPGLRRFWPIGVSLFGLLIVLLIQSGQLGRLQALTIDDGNSVSRIEIWNFALQEITARPFLGSNRSFRTAWLDNHIGDTRTAPNHAHNLWLQMGFQYGAAGITLALILTICLLIIALRGHGLSGLIYVSSVLLMNLFDYTLFYVGIWLPLILFLQSKNPPNKGIILCACRLP